MNLPTAAQGAGMLVKYLEDANSKEIEQAVSRKVDHHVEIVHKDISALKGYLDVKFATKEDLAVVRIDLTKEIAAVRTDLTKEITNTKADIIKWMFLFWIGQVGVVIGFLFLYLKK